MTNMAFMPISGQIFKKNPQNQKVSEYMTWKCNTITHCRPTYGSLRNRHRTLMTTLHQKAIKVKQPALLIAYLESTLKVLTTKQEPRTKTPQNNIIPTTLGFGI